MITGYEGLGYEIDTLELDTGELRQHADFEDNTRRKVPEFAHAMRPGCILDIGCATDQTLTLLPELPGLFESDFYGVESARPLLDVCQQRRSDGDFGTANDFFRQRNIMETTLFAPNSLDAVITMAVTHEIKSYLGHADLEDFIFQARSMLHPGGVWINYDVAAPDHGGKEILVRFRTDDGSSSRELAGLNSRTRFERFAHNFRSEEGDGIIFGTKIRDGEEYVRLTRSALYEFLVGKDYVDSWFSEAHGRFCFFSPDDCGRQWRGPVSAARRTPTACRTRG